MKRLAGFLFMVLTTIAAAVGFHGTAQAATPSCTVDYAVNGQWSGVFQAQITVSYSGFPAGNGWTLAFDFVASGQRIINAWNGTWSQAGSHVTASSGPYPGVIASDGSITLSFFGAYGAVNPPPENFVFDGTPCTEVSPVGGARGPR